MIVVSDMTKPLADVSLVLLYEKELIRPASTFDSDVRLLGTLLRWLIYQLQHTQLFLQ